MSVSLLQTAVAPQRAPQTIASLLAQKNVQQQIALALPKHMTAERLARVATTEVRKNPLLAEADQASFLGALMQCAQLGLEPGGALGHAYLLPFRNNTKNIIEVQFIIGYRGMIDLSRRSGQIISIEAHPVYECDEFRCQLGLESNLVHIPDWDNPNRGNPSALRFVYAVAKLQGGGVQFEVMGRREIDMARARSKSPDKGPWKTDFIEMAKKTVVRRMFKFLPVSIEMASAVALDEAAEIGKSQDNASVVDGTWAGVSDDHTGPTTNTDGLTREREPGDDDGGAA